MAWVTGTLHRKQQESSSKTGTVSSLVSSSRWNYGKVASRNHAEISQEVVNTSIHAQKMPSNQWQLQHSSL